MRVDVVSIFPGYLDALNLSLPGRARREGLLDLRVHDLRHWTHDRHRTVDDTPYGGGAGMVMRPEPWGEALDDLTSDEEPPLLVVPTPAGAPFTQATAADLARRPWLLFACGRYEGIDQRVVEHYRGRGEVRELSVGDYVLNGGEVATLVMIEATVRLLPGFLGNPESLTVESHADGLLEAPVYTKPPTWRGLEVPAVLRGGDHGAVEAWRREEGLRRTVAHRPDLAPASALLAGTDLTPRPAAAADVAEIFVLQRACWLAEAQVNQTLAIPALAETLPELAASLGEWRTWVVRTQGRLVASVRGRLDGDRWDIGRLMVAPDLEGRGLGRALLEFAEAQRPEEARGYSLFTGSGSEDNLRMYRRAGYSVVGEPAPGVAVLHKPVR